MFRKIGDLTMIGDEVWQIVGLAAGLCSMKSGGVREPLGAEFALATPGGPEAPLSRDGPPKQQNGPTRGGVRSAQHRAPQAAISDRRPLH
jgi:hypothetical protein